MTHKDHEDLNDAPKADSVRGFKCEKCEHLHLELIDEDDQVLATAIVTREMLLGMLGVIDEKPALDS